MTPGAGGGVWAGGSARAVRIPNREVRAIAPGGLLRRAAHDLGKWPLVPTQDPPGRSSTLVGRRTGCAGWLGRAFLLVLLAGGPEASASGGSHWLDGEPTHESRFSSILPGIARFPEPVRHALAAGIALGRNNWAWTERTTTSKSETLCRWDPSQPRERRIILLEQDGALASALEQERFFKREESELESYAREQPSMRRRMVAIVGAMEFLPLGASERGLEFALRFGEPDYAGLAWIDRMFVRVVTQLRGVLAVDAERPGIVSARISKAGTISLMPGLRIRELEVAIDSDYFPEARTWLPVRMSVRMEGSLWLFGSIARSVDFEFSDYANVGLPPLDLIVVLAGMDANDRL